MSEQNKEWGPQEILETVLANIEAYGQGWRHDWSWFDGRTLRNQMNGLIEWAESNPTTVYSAGIEFLLEQTKDEQN